MTWFSYLLMLYLLIALSIICPVWLLTRYITSPRRRRGARAMIVAVFIAPSVVLAGHGLMPAPAVASLLIACDQFRLTGEWDWFLSGVLGTGMVPILVTGLLIWGGTELVGRGSYGPGRYDFGGEQ